MAVVFYYEAVEPLNINCKSVDPHHFQNALKNGQNSPISAQWH